MTPPASNNSINRTSLAKYAWLSILAAMVTISLKTGAYFLTGSIGLLSDALESIVNLFAAIVTLIMLTIAARPPDKCHEYGHSKAEYFASGVEGSLIFVAAFAIIWSSAQRLSHPQELEQLGLGLSVSVLASLINLLVSKVLTRAARNYNSISLEADAKHLMTDVWTSAGVFLGVGTVGLTGWSILDPIVAILVALNIIWIAISLINRSIAGLMDAALPPEEQEKIKTVIKNYNKIGIKFHALRTRQAAAKRFITVHMLVPGNLTVHDAHHIAEDFERDIRASLGDTIISTHLEPIEDEISMDDINEQ